MIQKLISCFHDNNEPGEIASLIAKHIDSYQRDLSVLWLKLYISPNLKFSVSVIVTKEEFDVSVWFEKELLKLSWEDRKYIAKAFAEKFEKEKREHEQTVHRNISNYLNSLNEN